MKKPRFDYVVDVEKERLDRERLKFLRARQARDRKKRHERIVYEADR